MAIETIAEAKQHLRDHWEKGCKCPACGQLVKLYKRKLNSGMAYFMMRLYKMPAHKEDYLHASIILGKSFSMDYATLRHWKLIEEQPNSDDAKKTSGYWRLTEKGYDFVLDRLTVPSHVHIYNNTIVGWSEEHTNIKQALGKKFDYSELMRGL